MSDQPDNSPEERQRIMELLATARPGWMDEQIAPLSQQGKVVRGPDVMDIGHEVLINPPRGGGGSGGDGEDGEDGVDGADGADGLQIELQTSTDYIQWRYADADPEDTWKNLVLLADLKGEDGEDGTDGTNGKEVELGIDDGYIAWRYVTDPVSEWTPLVALEDLKGEKGDAGDPGDGFPDGETTGEILILQWSGTEWVKIPDYAEHDITLCTESGPLPFKILARPNPPPEE